MPYRTKKRTYRRYKRRGGVKKMVKAMIAKNVETKLVVATFTDVSLTTSGLLPYSYAFNDIGQGVTQQSRVGNQIRCTSMKYNFFITGADATNSIRILFYIPKDPNVIISGLNFNQAPDLDQFTILKDMFISTSNTGNNCVRRVGWLNFKKGRSSGMITQYTSPAGNSVSRNRILMYAVSDSSLVNHPVLNGYTSLYYKDA